MESVIVYGLLTSIFAGAKAHSARTKKLLTANFYGVLGIAGYVVAVLHMFN